MAFELLNMNLCYKFRLIFCVLTAECGANVHEKCQDKIEPECRKCREKSGKKQKMGTAAAKELNPG